MNETMTIKWIDFDQAIRIQLLTDRAPALCAAIAKALPLRSISWHSVISGENVGFPLPVVWTAVDNPSPRRRGDVFFYANGQLGIIPYGVTTEPGLVNVFGRVFPDDLEAVSQIGRAVATSFQQSTGNPYFVELKIVR